MRPPDAEVPYGTLDLMVLKTLEAMSPLHGYGIARRIEQVAQGVARPEPGHDLPGAAAARAERLDQERVGHEREQPPRPLLRDHARRPQAAAARDRQLGAHRRDDEPPAGGPAVTSPRVLVPSSSRASSGPCALFDASSRRRAERRDRRRISICWPKNTCARGMSPPTRARRRGATSAAWSRSRKRYRDQRGLPFVDTLAQDLRFAVRLLRRDPRFGVVTIGSLALSIGAITFVFSVVNALMLRPLPVADPESVYSCNPGGHLLVSRTIASCAIATTARRAGRLPHRAGQPGPRPRGRVRVGLSGDRQLFRGARRPAGAGPLLLAGRGCGARRGAGRGAQPRLLAHALPGGRQRGRADGLHQRAAVHRARRAPPEGFHGTEIFYRPDLWVPMMMQPAIEPGNNWLERRTTQNTYGDRRGHALASRATRPNRTSPPSSRAQPRARRGSRRSACG